jgi:hypothetical protein
MNQKTFDCVQMQRNIRDTLLKEANYNLKELVTMIKENNQISPLFKQIIERKEKEKQQTTA